MPIKKEEKGYGNGESIQNKNKSFYRYSKF